MLHWLREVVRKLFHYRSDHRQYVYIRSYGKITPDPPPMHWAPCHPSTMRKFKASMTCPYGHGLTLGQHSIASTGEVFPSVICPANGCTFHEFVKLDHWTLGELS